MGSTPTGSHNQILVVRAGGVVVLLNNLVGVGEHSVRMMINLYINLTNRREHGDTSNEESL